MHVLSWVVFDKLYLAMNYHLPQLKSVKCPQYKTIFLITFLKKTVLDFFSDFK